MPAVGIEPKYTEYKGKDPLHYVISVKAKAIAEGRSITDDIDKEAFEKYLKWLLGTFKGIARCGKGTKPLLIESKTYMREQLTKQERKMLTNYTAQVNRILTNIELEDELGL